MSGTLELNACNKLCFQKEHVKGIFSGMGCRLYQTIGNSKPICYTNLKKIVSVPFCTNPQFTFGRVLTLIELNFATQLFCVRCFIQIDDWCRFWLNKLCGLDVRYVYRLKKIPQKVKLRCSLRCFIFACSNQL